MRLKCAFSNEVLTRWEQRNVFEQAFLFDENNPLAAKVFQDIIFCRLSFHTFSFVPFVSI